MKFLRKFILAGAAIAALAGPASAATITVVNNGVQFGADGKLQVVAQETTVATFTAVQNVAVVAVGGGSWLCEGQANMGTVTNASVINVGISKTTGALPTKTTDGVSAFGSISTQTTQANATAGFPTAFAGPAWFHFNQGTFNTVFLVESQSVSDTVTAALQCIRLGD